jgi:enoyl-CoA hydratase/carnithine racemase
MILQIYSLVIRLLPLAANFGLGNTGRLRELFKAEGVSRDAAARAMSAGRVKEAVEMLEEGRGVFWSQALRTRATDMDVLPSEDAGKLRLLFQTIETQITPSDLMTAAQRERQFEQNRKLSEEAEALIAEIRARPGMERFLLPATFASMVQALPDGFVVLLNVSEFGYHALVLNGARSVHSLPLQLPKRVVGKGRRIIQQQSSRDNSTGKDEILEGASEQFDAQSVEEEETRAGIRDQISTFEDTLADLWMCIVKPIIDLLKLKVRTP